jgi:hypothetical protein
MDVPLGSVGVASTRPEVQEKLAPYQSALDLPIVRVLATLRDLADRSRRRRAAVNGLTCASPTRIGESADWGAGYPESEASRARRRRNDDDRAGRVMGALLAH